MTWPITRMGEYFRVKHGYAFKGEYFDSHGPFVLLTPGSFNEEGGYRDQGEKTKFYTGDVPEGYVLNEGDLLVAMTEQAPGLLGSSAWIPESGRFLHNQRLGRIVDLDERRLSKRFLYYLFNTKNVRDQISATATGGKVRHTAPERIGQVKFGLAPLDVQRRIANILCAYDDLIENNSRRMELLEEAARQLYREWFVRLRFPGHEHTRIINGVPEGWANSRVCDFGRVITGKTPSTKDADNYDGEIPFIKTPDMHGNVFVTQTEAYLSEKGANSQPGKYVPPGTLLVSCIGTIGVVAITSSISQFNQQINAVIPSEQCFRYYCFFALKDLKPRMESIGGGATMGNVNKTKFESLNVLRPRLALLREFDNSCAPMFRQINVLALQNQKLRAARDLLLPRLMSGKIPV